MNFFERQDVARRNSRLLMVLFVLATTCIVLAMDLAVITIWYGSQFFYDSSMLAMPWWLHALVIGATAALILGVSLRKSIEMRAGGGVAVARMMDARQVIPLKANPMERRLLNVVHEMAIASGTRVPLVYVMDQHGGINSFAAGYDGQLCVIVVTRGALERLNRDEIQAVIAHEFSHIVNGDMALNMRMVGVLAGLVFIGGAGAHLLRVAMEEAHGDFRAILFLMASGATLFCIGYIGLFFAQAIKAMIAREREFLADAGSVQFTRNPEGLAGALDQVRHLHSFVLHLHSEDVSHLFFAEAVYLDEERVLSTHPPLGERIARLVPRFGGEAYRSRRSDPYAELQRAAESAASPMRSLPQSARIALETRVGCGGLLVALMLSKEGSALANELAALRAAGLDNFATSSAPLAPHVGVLPVAWHLPLADLALAHVRAEPEEYRRDLVRALETLLATEHPVSLYRFAYLAFVRAQLAPDAVAKSGNRSIDALRDDVVLLLSLVAHAGCVRSDTAAGDFARAFASGAKEMELRGPLNPMQREGCDPVATAKAIERLRDLGPFAKARLVKGVAAAVTADGSIRVVEAALLRMVGAVLDCPLPPTFEELNPATLAA